MISQRNSVIWHWLWSTCTVSQNRQGRGRMWVWPQAQWRGAHGVWEKWVSQWQGSTTVDMGLLLDGWRERTAKHETALSDLYHLPQGISLPTGQRVSHKQRVMCLVFLFEKGSEYGVAEAKILVNHALFSITGSWNLCQTPSTAVLFFHLTTEYKIRGISAYLPALHTSEQWTGSIVQSLCTSISSWQKLDNDSRLVQYVRNKWDPGWKGLIWVSVRC